MSWLQSAGLDQHTILVIVGDHGEGLGSHGEGTHGFFVYDYAVHVPLIIATPFDELHGVRVESQVSLVDVFPTVLALAGIDAKATRPRAIARPVDVPARSAGERLRVQRVDASEPAVRVECAPLRCARRDTSSSRRRGPSCTTSLRIRAKRRTSSHSIGP